MAGYQAGRFSRLKYPDLGGKSLLTDHRNESASFQDPHRNLLPSCLLSKQVAGSVLWTLPTGNDKASAGRKLVNQGRRNERRGRGNNDHVVRRAGAHPREPSAVTISTFR